MARYVLAIDQGTTSTRCMIFDRTGSVVCADQQEHRQIFPRPGWVEHDPKEIWQRTQQVIAGAMRKGGITRTDLVAIGITNQRETTLIWDRQTGEPIHNAIVWQDTRTDTIINQFAREGGQDRFRDRVGLPLATYFAGPKARWMLDHVAGAREAAERGDLCFGTIDTFLVWWLSGGPQGGAFVTDVTNASRTMLMNLQTLDWDDRDAGGYADSTRDPARDPAVEPGLCGARKVISKVFRSPVSWAISRLRWSARPAIVRVRPRIPMAPATLCCSTPELSQSPRSMVC